MTTSTDLDTEAYRITFASALRRCVGFGKFISVEALSDQTGIPVPSIKQYMQGGSCAPYDRICRMAAVLPETFTDDILHPAGLGGAHRLTNEEPNPFRLMKWLGKAIKQIAAAMADGKFCERERRKMLPVMQELARMCIGFCRRWGRVA